MRCLACFPFFGNRQAHFAALNSSLRVRAISTTSFKVSWRSCGPDEISAISSAQAVALTMTPSPRKSLPFSALRNNGSTAWLKTVVLSASPCRTPAVSWTVTHGTLFRMLLAGTLQLLRDCRYIWGRVI